MSASSHPSQLVDDIMLDELQYVCDEKGQPQVLGKGAYGQVSCPSGISGIFWHPDSIVRKNE